MSLEGIAALPIFANSETEKLALLSPNGRKTRLQDLMSLLSMQRLCASTDDDLLDDADDQESREPVPDNESPPPIPPRTNSITSIKLNSIEKKPSLEFKASSSSSNSKRNLSSFPSPKKSPKLETVSEAPLELSTSSVSARSARNLNQTFDMPWTPKSPRNSGSPSKRRSPPRKPALPYSSNYYMVGRVDTDSDDSSDDFVPFVPPQRNRFPSEPFVHQQVAQWTRERRTSSPFPEVNKEQQPLKKSSPILTKRPGWFAKPYKQTLRRNCQSEVLCNVHLRQDSTESQAQSRKLKYRSKSLDDREKFAVASTSSFPAATATDSDDNTGGTLESKDYSKPFEHLLWRKLGMDDGSALSGSLPHLDKVAAGSVYEDEEDPDGCTYLDPKELEDFCEKKFGGRELSDRICKRFSTVLNSPYLTLSTIADFGIASSKPSSMGVKKFPTSKKASTFPAIRQQSPVPPPRNTSPSFLASVSRMERYRKTLELADNFCLSGYSTDASSGWGEPDFSEADQIGRMGRMQSWKTHTATDNTYDEIKPALSQSLRSESPAGGAREEGEEEEIDVEATEEEQIYEEIDQYSDTTMVESALPLLQENRLAQTLPITPNQHTNLQISHSMPGGEGYSRSQFHQDRTNPLLPRCNSDRPYAKLSEISTKPPSLPPRPLRKLASLDPSQPRRRHYFKKGWDSKVPGVCTLTMHFVLSCVLIRGVTSFRVDLH